MAVTNITKIPWGHVNATRPHKIIKPFLWICKIRNRNLRRMRHFSNDPSFRAEMNRLNAVIKRDIRHYNSNKLKDFIDSLSYMDNSIWNYLKRFRKPFTPFSPPCLHGYRT